jgi:uncharacterized protein YehS (DUF1456 family)
MTNNSALQKIQFAFHLELADVLRIYERVHYPMDTQLATGYFIDNKHENYVACPNQALAAFLDGLIIERRGPSEKNPIPAEFPKLAMDNNDIFKKLRIAMDLHSEDVEVVLGRANLDLTNIDLSAIFRKKGHKHYKVCSDKILESFLIGIRIAFKPKS